MNNRDIQIKNYEGWFQRAAPVILTRAGCSQLHVAQRVLSAKLPATRIDILFVKGPAAEISVNDNGDEYEDDIAARLILTLSTKREQSQPVLIDGVQGLHEEWAAQIRAAIDFKENPFKNLLPFYTVTHIREGQNDRDLDLSFWMDYTRIPFDLRFSVHSGACNMTDAQIAAFSAAAVA
jgi:hypothetical protein